MVRLTRRGFTTGAIAMLGAACGGMVDESGSQEPGYEPPRSDPFEPQPIPEPVPEPADPRLAFGPITPNAVPPSTVWSWTTAEQAEEIRRDAILFTRESSPTLGRGYLFDVLEKRAASGDAAAARLVGMELAKGRYGWSNPWATVRGATAEETYGLELLAIEMRTDTWYARVHTALEDIDFVDAKGQPVATATALASFDRVGGILFDNDLESSAYCSTGFGGGGLIYREIYVGSEARLATFSHRTAPMLAVLDGHIKELEAFRDWLQSGGNGHAWPRDQWSCFTSRTWNETSLTSSVERYLASLAFATDPYAPEAVNVDAIVTELKKARFTPDPFTHSP